MKIEIPRPTEEELKPFNKVDYYHRLMIDMEYEKKLKVDNYKLSRLIHENYDSWLLTGRGLKFDI